MNKNMSGKNDFPNKSIYQKNNNYLLSSWNYGSYSPCNPYYKTCMKYHYNSKTNPNNQQPKPKLNCDNTKKITETNIPNKKRRLKEDERIVTNEYLKSFYYYKKLQSFMKNGQFRPKSVTRIKVNNINNFNDNNIDSGRVGKNQKELKTDINSVKKSKIKEKEKIRCKLTFAEWLQVKDKQRECFNIILKKNKIEENKKMIERKKKDIKYNKIKEQKIKEWLQKKNIENIIKKEIEKRIEDFKEEEKKQKMERKEEIMNNWFKTQAEKMEKEIEDKRRKKQEEKKEKIRKKKEIEEKKIKGKEAFKRWREIKEQEMKIKKRKENIKKRKEEEQKRKEYLKRRVKSFIIGPYTDAAALRQIQNNLMENNFNNSDFDM